MVAAKVQVAAAVGAVESAAKPGGVSGARLEPRVIVLAARDPEDLHRGCSGGGSVESLRDDVCKASHVYVTLRYALPGARKDVYVCCAL